MQLHPLLSWHLLLPWNRVSISEIAVVRIFFFRMKWTWTHLKWINIWIQTTFWVAAAVNIMIDWENISKYFILFAASLQVTYLTILYTTSVQWLHPIFSFEILKKVWHLYMLIENQRNLELNHEKWYDLVTRQKKIRLKIT